jgi:WS/DGAT/MGAT family acyltransferase
MKQLSLLDLVFFMVESEESPKHVAGLMRLQKPKGAPADYVPRLLEEMQRQNEIQEPFSLVINFLGLTGPRWEYCRDFAFDNHLFYHRPRRSMSWEETLELVGLLHEPLLDRSKPLWELHVIDGIRGRKFAAYLKLHHAYADGVTMTSWLSKTLSDKPAKNSYIAPWAMPPEPGRETTPAQPGLGTSLFRLAGLARRQVRAAAGIAKIVAQQTIERTGLTEDAVALYFNTERDTLMTGSTTPGRNVATAAIPMDRIKRVGKTAYATLNHVALSCIDGAIHQYLADRGIVLDHPISIQMPVNLRSSEDGGSGNKIGITLVDMAEPTDDPYRRLREIGFKLKNVKTQVAGIPASAFEQFTVLAAGASEVIDMLHLTDYLPTNGHALVSNVPGPTQPLWLNESLVERMYPVSTLSPGLRLNITMFSYAGMLHFGLVSTRDLDDLQSLANAIVDEFERLEKSIIDRY